MKAPGTAAVTYTDKTGGTATLAADKYSVEYSVDGSNWDKTFPANAVGVVNVDTKFVHVRVVPNADAVEGYTFKTWNGQVSLEVVPLKISDATAEIAADADRKFGTDWKVAPAIVLTQDTNQTTVDAGKIAKIAEALAYDVTYYADADLTKEIAAADLTKHAGDIYYTVTLKPDDNLEIAADKIELGGAGTLSFTVAPNDSLTPKAAFGKDEYVAAYTGKDVTDAVSFKDVTYDAPYKDIALEEGDVTFTYAKKEHSDPANANNKYTVTPKEAGDYYVKATVTKNAYFASTTAVAYAPLTISKAAVTVTLPDNNTTFGYTGNAVDYEGLVKVSPESVKASLKFSYAGQNGTSYSAETAPKYPGSYSVEVSKANPDDTSFELPSTGLTGTFIIEPKLLEGTLTIGTVSGDTVGSLLTAASLSTHLAGTTDVEATTPKITWTVTTPDGKALVFAGEAGKSDTTKLVEGTYTVKATVEPVKQDTAGLPVDYKYDEFVKTEFNASYTKTGDPTTVYFKSGFTGAEVKLTYADGKSYTMDDIRALAYKEGDKFGVYTNSNLTDGDITGNWDQYKLVLVKANKTGTAYEVVDSISDAGTYYLYAISTGANAELADKTAIEADTAGVKVTIAPQRIAIEYTPVVVNYDGKAHKDAVTLAAFQGKTQDGAVVALTEDDIADPFIVWDSTLGSDNKFTDVGNYPFEAKFAVSGNYAADATVKGVMKIVGVGTVNVQFNERSYTKAYTGKTQRLTSADFTITNGEEGSEKAATLAYFNEKGTQVGEPSNAGKYTVRVTVPSINNKNEATDEVPFEITKADVKFAWNALADNAKLEDKEVAFSADVEANVKKVLPIVADAKGVDDATVVTADAPVTYKFYRDGELLTKKENGKDVPMTAADLTADVLEPGVYTATAEWTNVNVKGEPVNGNYNPAALITSNKVTVVAGGLNKNQVPDFAADSANGKIAYGDDIEGHLLYKVTGQSAPKLNGAFYTTGTGKADKVGNASLRVVFVADGYKPYSVGLKTIEVAKATLTEEDVKITNTEVAKYDGKAYALGGVEVAKKFSTDNLTVEYSKTKSSGWSTDINSVKFTEAGNHIVWVRTNGDNKNTNYAEGQIFSGYVAIGVTKSTLSMEDTTAAYKYSTDKVQPKVTIKTEDGKTVTVDPKYLTYTVAEYTENKLNAAYTAKTLADMHVVKDGYWVKAEVKPEAIAGDLASYYLGDGKTVYARYNVTKADLDSKRIPSTVDSKVEVSGGKYDSGDVKELSTITDFSKAVTEKKNVTNPYGVPTASQTNKGWTWVNGEQDLTPATDFTVQFVPEAANLDTDAANLLKDYNLPTAKVNVVVAPEGITVDSADVTSTPKTAPYGLKLGDIEVTGLDKVVVKNNAGKELEGTWVWKDGSDFVPKVTDTSKDKDATDAYTLVFADSKNPSFYSAEIKVNIQITKAEPVITVSGTKMVYTGNPASLKIESTNTETEPVLTWYDASGNTMAGAPTQIGKYKVKVSQEETKSFKAGSVTVDYEITYNQTGIEGFVYRLYAVALGREPDQNGYTMWVNLLKAKEYTPKSVAYGFIFSPEFTNRKYDNATFLNVMYKTFMDREPDASGYAMWLKGLNSGEYTREFVFQGFADSREFTNICARYGL